MKKNINSPSPVFRGSSSSALFRVLRVFRGSSQSAPPSRLCGHPLMVALVLSFIVCSILPGCVAVPFPGDHITVKTKDTTVLVITDIDLTASMAAELGLLSKASAEAQPRRAGDATAAERGKAPNLPSEPRSPQNASIHAPALKNKNAMAFRQNAKHSKRLPNPRDSPWLLFPPVNQENDGGQP